jgi:two-component system cell cycle response regulator DivK
MEHRQPVAHLGENQRAASGHGHTATRQIKTDPAFRSIPIIAVTSYALSGDEKKAQAAGCDDYVPKPFSPRQPLAKITQYLS